MDKKHFEQVPVEIVKKISEVDPPIIDGSGYQPMNDPLATDRPTRRDVGTHRPWQEIAREVAYEADPVRMVELCRELNAALLAEEERRNPRVQLSAKANGDSFISGVGQ